VSRRGLVNPSAWCRAWKERCIEAGSWFKGREAKYKQLEARRQVRTARERVPAGGAAASTEAAGDGEAVGAVPVAASAAAATRATARTGGPARPRPKSKRKPPAKKRRR